jgi:hypothetical protein
MKSRENFSYFHAICFSHAQNEEVEERDGEISRKENFSYICQSIMRNKIINYTKEKFSVVFRSNMPSNFEENK